MDNKKIYLVANWKSHKTLAEAEQFVAETVTKKEGLVQTICSPFPYLISLHQLIQEKQLSIMLGVQDISPYPLGAYTGAVAADMVKEWARYAIVGHSERRRYFHETEQEVANKVSLSLEVGITPIVCVDEPYLQRQIEMMDKEQCKKCIFAYEPLEAIGSGHPDTPEHANTVAQIIHSHVESVVPVLYGGSVTAENIKSFTNQPHIAGALVGGASLEPAGWVQLVRAVKD